MAILVTSGPGFIGSNFRIKGATFFAYHVKDPQRYSMADFDGEGRVLSLEYKPIKPKSSYAVTGLFFYDERDVDYTKLIKPSPRGGLKITDLNKLYLEDGELTVKKWVEAMLGWIRTPMEVF
jgi:glucose-1-phosphate thymidylyltransferase